MLTILRTQPTGSALATFLEASVSLRKGNDNVAGCPDIAFSMKTYEKIARDGGDQVGDMILLPINLFFELLSYQDQKELYDMYAYSRRVIGSLTKDNLRETQKALQERIFNTVRKLKLSNKMVAFCQTERFIYPDLSEAGTLPHHSPEKTFMARDYVEVTAISLISKMMVPIWGEFIKELGVIGINNNQRERIAFDLIEPTLEEDAFERIYNKLSFTVSMLVKERRKITDKKATLSNTTSSFILTHNGINDKMFDDIVMSTIIVKRMATYECFKFKEGNIPNAMVYIDDGTKRTADTRIQGMRNSMNTMPRRELSQHGDDDNSSIIDHASKTSKKPMDVPIFVVTAVENWELPKLLEDTNTPIDVFNAACEYYANNPFDVSPLCQSMVSSFIGTRFGGSKCLNYLPPKTYQKVVVMLQIYLIRTEMYDLAALISAKTPSVPIDGPYNPIASRIDATLKSSEYLQCQTLFKGYIEKPVSDPLKRATQRKIPPERIDFVNLIKRLIEWLVRYNHSENMAPALWAITKNDSHPIIGSEVLFDETVIKNLCRFYLTFHGGKRPF